MSEGHPQSLRTLMAGLVPALAAGLLLVGCEAPMPETASEQDAVAAPEAMAPGSGPEGAPSTLAAEDARRAAALALQITAEPDRTVEILEEAGFTPESFEARLLRIASDPELSRVYQEAMGG